MKSQHLSAGSARCGEHRAKFLLGVGATFCPVSAPSKCNHQVKNRASIQPPSEPSLTSHNKEGVYKHFVCILLHEQVGFSGRAPSRREHTRLTTHRNLFQVPIFSKTRSSPSPAEARGLTELHSPQAMTVNTARNALLILPRINF